MSNQHQLCNQYIIRKVKTMLLTLALMVMTGIVSVAAPVGQTIWIKSSATGQFVSADQDRGAYAPLVADRPIAQGWEQFQVIDVGGGYVALKSIGNGLFVSADQARGAYAPLVADRGAPDTWEHFLWADLQGSTFTLKGRVTDKFVCADLNRGDYAPLVSDRTAASTWETFSWGVVGSNPPIGAPPGFPNLIWADEFNGAAIDGANWTYDLGASGWGNNELQNYTNRTENARIENGSLVIEARNDNFGGSAYSSARMKTQGRRTFGVNTWVEARLKVPEGQGIWPAFWMLGSSISTVGWPSCGEIDIMELRGQNPYENIGTMHWANADGSHASYGNNITSPVSFAAGYHTFAISRTPTAIKWYLDGVQYHEANIAGGINSTSEFQGQFFVILNVAVGGNFVGPPNASTTFPQRLTVDYVRVWGQ